MKILYTSLDTFLDEVQTAGRRVRVTALMHSTLTPAMTAQLYAGWIVVTAALEGSTWAEWRMLVGRQRAELTDLTDPTPPRLTKRTEERLVEVRARIEARGLTMAPGLHAHDAE